ncbi:hypothetical protein CCACVL1_30598 [Corchorus capsularis]|uniref:Uncharacterized protein n=1 Tax=Corchorus capsularis TaxID=210143 RepID=A0A1R3FWC2_COCAP|nr:hypothetical protein CCACVL1_30598 [Corchorus capsularis]
MKPKSSGVLTLDAVKWWRLRFPDAAIFNIFGEKQINLKMKPKSNGILTLNAAKWWCLRFPDAAIFNFFREMQINLKLKSKSSGVLTLDAAKWWRLRFPDAAIFDFFGEMQINLKMKPKSSGVLTLDAAKWWRLRRFSVVEKWWRAACQTKSESTVNNPVKYNVYSSLPSDSEAFMVSHVIGDIVAGDIVEPEVVVSAAPSVGGLLDSLTGSIGISGISSRAKLVTKFIGENFFWPLDLLLASSVLYTSLTGILLVGRECLVHLVMKKSMLKLLLHGHEVEQLPCFRGCFECQPTSTGSINVDSIFIKQSIIELSYQEFLAYVVKGRQIWKQLEKFQGEVTRDAGLNSPWAPMSLACAPRAFASGPRSPEPIWVLGGTPDWRWAPMRHAWRPMCSSATMPLDISKDEAIDVFANHCIYLEVEEFIHIVFYETNSAPRKVVQDDDDADLPKAWKYGKSHPPDLIIGNPSESVRTRGALREVCEFAAFISQIEPKVFKDAKKEESWMVAIQEELNQFERNKVWTLVPPPVDHLIVGRKWVYAEQPLGVEDSKYPDYVYRLNKALYGLKFLHGTTGLGLRYPKGSLLDLVGYSDADFAGSKTDRKSTSGTCQFLGQMLVSWSSKKQNSVALSTAEAEYIAAGSCCAQLIWIMHKLRDFGITVMKVPLNCDNTSAINIIKNPVQHSRTKFIEIRHHFIRDHVQRGDIKIERNLESKAKLEELDVIEEEETTDKEGIGIAKSADDVSDPTAKYIFSKKNLIDCFNGVEIVIFLKSLGKYLGIDYKGEEEPDESFNGNDVMKDMANKKKKMICGFGHIITEHFKNRATKEQFKHKVTPEEIKPHEKDLVEAINTLHCALNDTEFNRVSTCTTAKEIWEKLRVRHEGTSQVKQSKINMLQYEYETFKMVLEETMTSLIDRFSSITNRLSHLGKNIPEGERVKKLLRALPKSWNPLTTAIRQARDLNETSFDEICCSLLTHEVELRRCEDDEKKMAAEKKRCLALKVSALEKEIDSLTIDDTSLEPDEETEIQGRRRNLLYKRNFKKD